MPSISQVTVGSKVTAYQQNNIITPVNLQGYTMVIPTSVAGTGVSLATTGKITLSGSSTITVNGCFTSSYERYLVELDGVASGTPSWTFVFRLAGSNITTANYDETNLVARNSTVSSSTNVAGSSWPLFPAGTLQSMSLALSYPAAAQATEATMYGAFATNPQVASVNNGFITRTLTHRLATAYDGFQLAVSAGTFSGAIRIYGKNDG